MSDCQRRGITTGAMSSESKPSERAAIVGVTDSLRVGAFGADSVAIDFHGRAIQGRPGETLAAALTAAGERELRETEGGERRGLFCGMGVCQECLVEIDGQANQRACMTKLSRALSVRRQAPRAVAFDPSSADHALAGEDALAPDVLVVGGGAGGLNAATVAARAGAQVLLVDERPQPGGQYYKQPLELGGQA